MSVHSARPLFQKRIVVLLTIVLACVVACAGLYGYLALWPQYLALDVQPPGGDSWSYTLKAVQVWEQGKERYYI